MELPLAEVERVELEERRGRLQLLLITRLLPTIHLSNLTLVSLKLLLQELGPDTPAAGRRPAMLVCGPQGGPGGAAGGAGNSGGAGQDGGAGEGWAAGQGGAGAGARQAGDIRGHQGPGRGEGQGGGGGACEGLLPRLGTKEPR